MASYPSYDPHNANKGTARGRELLRESIDTTGYGRSILVDKHGVTIAGNKTLEAATERGADVEIVETAGHELVVVQRTDLDLRTDPKARQLAYYDNRVGEVGLDWDAEQIQRDVLGGIDLSSGFYPEEIATYAQSAATDFMDTDIGGATSLGAPQRSALITPDNSPILKEADVLTPAEPPPPPPPSVTIEFSVAGVEPRLRWTGLMRELKDRYPDMESVGDRLMALIDEREAL
jgi:hypothetical protein